MKELIKRLRVDNELKQLIEDAAKLLKYKFAKTYTEDLGLLVATNTEASDAFWFNPLDPERGDLMKVADAAKLVVGRGLVTNTWSSSYTVANEYISGDHQSLALAILRAASAVLKAKGEE